MIWIENSFYKNWQVRRIKFIGIIGELWNCTNHVRDQFHYGLSNNNYSCIINNVYSVYNVTVDLYTNAEIIALLMGLAGISPGTFSAMFQTVFMVLIN